MAGIVLSAFFIWLFLRDLRRNHSRDDITRTALVLSRRCTTPYPSLLAILIICSPLFLPLDAPSAESPGGDPRLDALISSFVFQAVLILGTVLTTMTLSEKSPVPNRLAARLPLPEDTAKPPVSFSRALWKGIQYGIFMLFVVQAATILVTLLISNLHCIPDTQPIVQWISDKQSSPRLKLFFILQSLTAGPLLEELFFRFTMMPSIAASNGGIVRAVLYSTALFTLLHGSLIGIIPLTILSVFCSVAYLATGRIITPIIMHVLFNASSILLILLQGTTR